MRMKALQSYYTKEEYAKSLLKSMEDKVIVFANTKEQADRVAPYSFYSGNTMSNHNLRMFFVSYHFSILLHNSYASFL